MSKNITIQEGGIGKQLTADKLKTNLVSGGTCLWVPEDETQLITKSVTKNGTYKASSDGAYGYSKVIVNVAGGSVSGKGQDGNTHNYSVDDDGYIVDEVIPDTIEVVTPPTNPYGIYQNGQTIAKDGMVVKAYNADETEYGTVTLDEITISPTTAVYDPATDTGGATVVDSDLDLSPTTQPFAIGGSFTWSADWGSSGSQAEAFHLTGTQKAAMFQYIDTPDGLSCVIADVNSGSFTLQRYRNGTTYGPEQSINLTRTYTYDGKTVYYYYQQFGYPNPTVDGLIINDQISIGKYGQVAWTMCYGTETETPAGSRQTITVTWPRPGDGKELTTTFEIRVAPGYTPGNSNEL